MSRRSFSTNNAFAALKEDVSVITWGVPQHGGDSSAVSGDLQSGVTKIFSTGSAFAALKGLPLSPGEVYTVAEIAVLLALSCNPMSRKSSPSGAFAALKEDGSVVTWGHSDYGGNSSAVSDGLQSGVTQIFSSKLAMPLQP